MENKPFVLPFNEVGEDEAPLVGGKGVRLAEMARSGLPVLPGFCVTTAAYRAFLVHNGLETAASVNDEAAVRARVATADLPPAVAREILDAYESLSDPVAVRSSATVSIMPSSSASGPRRTR